MKVAGCSEKSIAIYKLTWHYIPETSIIIGNAVKT